MTAFAYGHGGVKVEVRKEAHALEQTRRGAQQRSPVMDTKKKNGSQHLQHRMTLDTIGGEGVAEEMCKGFLFSLSN